MLDPYPGGNAFLLVDEKCLLTAPDVLRRSHNIMFADVRRS